jgi:hypothetical protein
VNQPVRHASLQIVSTMRQIARAFRQRNVLSPASDRAYGIYPTLDETVYPVPFLPDFSEILLARHFGSTTEQPLRRSFAAAW